MGTLFIIWVCIMSLTECRYSKYELRTGSLGFEKLGNLVLAIDFGCSR